MCNLLKPTALKHVNTNSFYEFPSQQPPLYSVHYPPPPHPSYIYLSLPHPLLPPYSEGMWVWSRNNFLPPSTYQRFLKVWK